MCHEQVIGNIPGCCRAVARNHTGFPKEMLTNLRLLPWASKVNTFLLGVGAGAAVYGPASVPSSPKRMKALCTPSLSRGIGVMARPTMRTWLPVRRL